MEKNEWPLLEKKVRGGSLLVFGYYGDVELEFYKGKFRTINTATGQVLYEGENFKKAFFEGKMMGKRYNNLDDKYFHNDMEKEMLRRF